MLAIAPSQQEPNTQDSREEVLAQLRAIGTRSSALEVELLAALWDLALVEDEELQQAWQELATAQEQCLLLQGRLERLCPTEELPAGVVRDLESIPQPAPCFFCPIRVSLKFWF